MHTTVIDTPTGLMELHIDGDTLVGLHFVDESVADRDDPSGIADRVRRYYEGQLDALDGIPVRFDTGTAFQQEVWHALRTIPVGETISYAELAQKGGRPTGFRAVGSANGRNPIAVVVPCHRVIAADGTLGGYSGGLDNKRWLLAHEGVNVVGEAPALF
jgi:methylated-DNA-[protein]-cysteine S-methyltransferase